MVHYCRRIEQCRHQLGRRIWTQPTWQIFVQFPTGLSVGCILILLLNNGKVWLWLKRGVAVPWLPVRQRIEFKLTLLAYKAICTLLSSYLTSNCQLVTAVRCCHLHSSDVPMLTITLNVYMIWQPLLPTHSRVNTEHTLPSASTAGRDIYRQFPRQLKSHLLCYDCNAPIFVQCSGTAPYLLS